MYITGPVTVWCFRSHDNVHITGPVTVWYFRSDVSVHITGLVAVWYFRVLFQIKWHVRKLFVLHILWQPSIMFMELTVLYDIYRSHDNWHYWPFCKVVKVSLDCSFVRSNGSSTNLMIAWYYCSIDRQIFQIWWQNGIINIVTEGYYESNDNLDLLALWVVYKHLWEAMSGEDSEICIRLCNLDCGHFPCHWFDINLLLLHRTDIFIAKKDNLFALTDITWYQCIGEDLWQWGTIV